ncbi:MULTISPECIES: metal ABC transporter permease [unclassified Acinetobacter]|uniref:metal ABC transporter permease n=1 Tax=unclassified Acinetobacter TaxID=196816 RepID=UPI0035BA4BD6
MNEWLNILAPAWLMGSILPFLTAPLGCIMLWRRMAFFADTMAHGTLLGLAIAGLMGLPLWIGVIANALLLVFILANLQDKRLPNDALLALCSSALLCSGLLLLQQIPALRAEVMGYLFGDLLSVTWQMIPYLLAVIIFGSVVLAITWKAQLRLSMAEDIAQSEGLSSTRYRLIFMLVLALFTVIALQVVGSLLMGALLVIPALTGRLLAKSPKQMLFFAWLVAEIAMTTGLWGSAWLDLATGLAIVLTMALMFIAVFVGQKLFFKYS